MSGEPRETLTRLPWMHALCVKKEKAMTQQQSMPEKERQNPQRPDQGQQWDPNKQGGKDPGQERFDPGPQRHVAGRVYL